MILIRLAVIYTALALGANAALDDTAALEELSEGSMRKLVFGEERPPVSTLPFTDRAGAEHRLGDQAGKYLLVNFWATWCVPCRDEMPALDALQRDLGGARFQVLTIAVGRNALAGIDRFFAEVGVTALPVLLDPRQALARDMGVLGLPMTVLVDPEGGEIARMIGDADWSGPSARAILAALLAEE
jgi:thiol-disulfide isomerase/thioredoxin